MSGRAPALAAAALLALAPAAARAADDGPAQPRLAAELLASATASVLLGMGESGYGLRLGLGAEREGRTPWGEPCVAGALVTAAWRNDAADGVGVPVDERRLGVGGRLRFGRLGIGADLELVRVSVDRVSGPGALTGTGLAARIVSSVDVVRLGRSAIVATLDVGLARVGLGREGATNEPSLSLSAGLRR